MVCVFVFFFFKQKTAYEMRISDWSSDVCSSDLLARGADNQVRRRQVAGVQKGVDVRRLDLVGVYPARPGGGGDRAGRPHDLVLRAIVERQHQIEPRVAPRHLHAMLDQAHKIRGEPPIIADNAKRSEENTSEIKSLMRKPYDDYCLN